MTGIGPVRFAVIALTAFVTVVDLFAAQAILPALRESYQTTPAMMSAAVNASTIGMAVGGFATALLSQRIERRRGIMLALALLAIPTLLLSQLPALAVFTALRVLQGLCMAAAFTLMSPISARSRPVRRRPLPSPPTSRAMSRAIWSDG